MKIEELIQSNAMPEGRKTVVHLLYTANLIQERTAEVLKPFGLSIPQFNVLRILRGRKGKPANLFTLQERMITKMSNTTRIVDKLLEKGLVERMVCESNRRKVEIHITDTGLDLLSQIDKPIDVLNDSFIASLSSKEVNQLNDLLEKLRS